MGTNNRGNNKSSNNDLKLHFPFDNGEGKFAEEVVTNKNYKINYVFNEAQYKENSFPDWISGVKNKALIFDGYSNYICVENNIFDNKTEAENLTISLWIAPRSYENPEETPSKYKLSALVNQHNIVHNKGFILGLSKHGRLSFKVGTGKNTVEIMESNNLIPVYKWSYITAVYNGSKGFIKLYLNGELISSSNVKSGQKIKLADEKLLIAKNNYPDLLADVFYLNMFDGAMDDLKIYNKALTDSEVEKIYNDYLKFNNGEIPKIDYDSLTLDPAEYNSDRHRPQYHIIAPGHWMNEPHAPFYYQGQYHLFYQHNPRGPYWHNIHWGHLTSKDLVHWEHQPVALRPEKDKVDADGDWSGSATFDEEGKPALFITAGNKKKKPDQGVAIVRPKDAENDKYLKKWVKPDQLDIKQPSNMNLTKDFRDPFPWKEGDSWYCLVGSGIKDEGGTALLFKSDDFKDWEFVDHFYLADNDRYPYLGPIWELPVLLPLGKDKNGKEKHIFMISPVGKGADVEVFYWIGNWNPEKAEFIPDQKEPQLIDYGDFHFTGPSGMIDPKTGRKIIFTIAQGDRYPQAEYDSGWAHNGGLPLNIYLQEDGKLGINPVEELKSLRLEKLLDLKNESKSKVNESLQNIEGDMLEINLTIDSAEAAQFGIKLRKTPDSEEETLIYYDLKKKTINIDRSKSTLNPELQKSIERQGALKGGKLDLTDGLLQLKIYLDKSMLECYANSQKSITSRVYPQREDAKGLSIWSDADILIKNISIWQMDSAYKY
jgi:sucrose-6-phosphate hydrolase SacC (GH32 family)